MKSSAGSTAGPGTAAGERDSATGELVPGTQTGTAPGATTSIFKLVGSTVAKESASLKSDLRGTQGFGWEGDSFTTEELEATEGWLRDRAVTIYGGTNEVQMNIISKRVLGLPD